MSVKTRVIAAFALLPLLLLIVLAAPKLYTAILIGLMAAVAAYELLIGTKIIKNMRLCLYSALVAFWYVLWCALGIHYAWLILAILLFWVALFAEMMASDLQLSFEKTAVCLCAGVILPVLFGSIVRIHSMEFGRHFVLIPFAIAFLSDTGAYFAGLRFGRRKLAVSISPKKTVEGVIGGVIGAVLGIIVYCAVLEWIFEFNVNYMLGIAYGIVGSAAGVFGDLCFSVIKRQAGVKDYGRLIPGHGGILDRFDSMMLVGPLTEVLLILLPMAVR